MCIRDRDKGIIFCLLSMINQLVYTLFFTTNIHIYLDLGYQSHARTLQPVRTLQALSLMMYFCSISVILLFFKVRFSNILFWIIRILQCIFFAIAVIQIISIYVEIPFLTHFVFDIFIGHSVMKYFIITILILSMIILGVIVVFSNMKEYFNYSKRKKVLVSIFFIGIVLVIYICINSFLYSAHWAKDLISVSNLSDRGSYFNSFEHLKNPSFYFYWGYMAFWVAILHYPLLEIVYLISLIDKEEESVTENINLSLNV